MRFFAASYPPLAIFMVTLHLMGWATPCGGPRGDSPAAPPSKATAKAATANPAAQAVDDAIKSGRLSSHPALFFHREAP